jgi:cysteine desulfurase
MLNLDANATYGLEPGILEYLSTVLPNCLNPSSVHQGGQKAKALIEEARQAVKTCIGGDKVLFTSGATEANNLVVKSFIQLAKKNPQAELVVFDFEHPSILEPAKFLLDNGYKVRIIPYRFLKKSNVTNLISEISSHTALLSIMLANNESGEIFPVKEITQALKLKLPNVIVHCDAVQALGKINFLFEDLGVDTLSFSGHKIGAMPGIGGIIYKKNTQLSPLIHGGPQEQRLRAGTENLPAIGALLYILPKIYDALNERSTYLSSLREDFWKIAKENAPNLVRNFVDVSTLPNTLSIRLPGVRADDFVIAMDLLGICISTGAACSSGKQEPSHVLLACGYSEEEARETVRVSFSHSLSKDDVGRAAKIFTNTYLKMSFLGSNRVENE